MDSVRNVAKPAAARPALPPGMVEVEAIRQHRHRVSYKGKRKILECFVQWEGFAESENTWQQASTFSTKGARDLLRRYKAVRMVP